MTIQELHPHAGLRPVVRHGRMGNATVEVVQGRLDAAGRRLLDETVRDLVDRHGVIFLRMELARLEGIDAGVLEVLRRAHRRLRELDGALIVVDPRPQVLEALSRAGLFWMVEAA